MRKNYIYAIFLFLLAFTSFGQKVTLTPTTVNGQSVSGGPINLGGTPNSTVGLGITVEMPAIPGNYGTITIHSVNGLNDNIVPGGNGGTLFFGEGKSASRSFVVNLLWSSFTTSGSYIYAEYKTGGGVIYKSSNLAIIKNATQGGGTPQIPADAPDPAKIPNTICCNQTIRLGEKPALIAGSQYLNPYQGQTYGINASWQVNGNPTVGILEADSANKTLSLDYVQNLGNFTVVRGLGYPTTLTPSNKSNTVTITVIPSPLNSNEISLDVPKNLNGYAEIISTNPKDIIGSSSVMNVTTLQNPSNVPKRSDKYVNIERYEWEYSLVDGTNTWINISNQNSNSLNSSSIPNLKIDNDNSLSIRRIAIYENLRIASNSLKVVLRTIRNNNTVCCDQKLKILSSEEVEKPSLIIGSTAVSDKNAILFYQWQQKRINNRESTDTWSDIPGATSKDYLPSPLKYVSNSRGSSIQDYSYRRIAQANYYGGEISYSNEINVSPSYDRQSPSSIIVYPNPATSIINIENKENVFSAIDTKISIVDIKGIEVNSNNFTFTNPNLISINISNLISGTYFINIQTIVSGRRTLLQFTFIKN